MKKDGILNPSLAALLCRFRHTNAIVIADRGFPSWPQIETIDLSLVDGIPTVVQVLEALVPNLEISVAYMAEEFCEENVPETRDRFVRALAGAPLVFEPHDEMKKRVPGAIGIVRTGDVTQFANVILVSGRPVRT